MRIGIRHWEVGIPIYMRLLDGTEMKRLGERRVEKTGHIFLQPMCIELEYPERILGFPVACCINRQNGTLGFVI